LDLAITIKQTDQVAYPLHVLAGFALEVGRCPVEATGDQWRKAAAHAWSDAPARIAADGLGRTMVPLVGQQAVQASLQRFAVDEPWHALNLERVESSMRSERSHQERVHQIR
jgi:hypothetical protein